MPEATQEPATFEHPVREEGRLSLFLKVLINVLHEVHKTVETQISIFD